jgi:hypothetical protein
MASALEGGEWSAARPGRTLPQGKTRYPLYKRLGGPQGRSGQVRKISPPPPSGIRFPGSPACSQSLYRLSYPAQKSKMLRQIEIKFCKLKLYDHLLGRCSSDTWTSTDQMKLFASIWRTRQQTDYSRLTTKKNLKDTEKTVSDEKKVVTSCWRTRDCDVYKPCCHGGTDASIQWTSVSAKYNNKIIQNIM